MEIDKEFETIKYMDRLINLENSKKALHLYKLPKDIRPCISNLLLTEVAKGDYPDRKRVGLFIAVELRRIGFKDSEVEVRVDHWNNGNEPPLPACDIRGVLKQSDKGNGKGGYKYSPGCNNDMQEYCVDKDLCFYYKNNFQKSKKTVEPDYIKLGWQNKLNIGQTLLLFHTIPALEKRREFKRGSKMYVSYRELSYLSGINIRYIGPYLRKLANHGLIEFVPGQPRIWEKKASEVKRVIPAPGDKRAIKKTAKKRSKSKKLASVYIGKRHNVEM